MSAKAALRKLLIKIRDDLAASEVKERSAKIQERLVGIPEVQAASSVFIYVSDSNEVETRDLIRTFLEAGKTVLVPIVTGEGLMEAHRIQSLDALRPGKYGILAPTEPDPFEGTPEVTLCPGVAFSSQGARLGRGKAFYDRFLAVHPTTYIVGLCYDFQVLDDVPVSDKDREVQLVVTETRELRV